MKQLSLFLSVSFRVLFLSLAFLPLNTLHAQESKAPTQTQSTEDPSFNIPISSEKSFRHYTLALTWQHGFCATPKDHQPSSCPSEPANAPLIGIHGLWASLPYNLAQKFPPSPTPLLWWQKGCALYKEAATLPSLSPQLQKDLARLMPNTLLIHEYQKHMQCFGMNATEIFHIEESFQARILNSAWGKFLIAHQNQEVSKEILLQEYEKNYGKLPERGLQFRCMKTHDGHSFLTQFWFTLKPDHLIDFPHSSAFLPSLYPQDNCPDHFSLSL